MSFGKSYEEYVKAKEYLAKQGLLREFEKLGNDNYRERLVKYANEVLPTDVRS